MWNVDFLILLWGQTMFSNGSSSFPPCNMSSLSVTTWQRTVLFWPHLNIQWCMYACVGRCMRTMSHSTIRPLSLYMETRPFTTHAVLPIYLKRTWVLIKLRGSPGSFYTYKRTCACCLSKNVHYPNKAEPTWYISTVYLRPRQQYLTITLTFNLVLLQFLPKLYLPSYSQNVTVSEDEDREWSPAGRTSERSCGEHVCCTVLVTEHRVTTA